MSKYKIGMYVRVAVDYEDDIDPRRFAVGQIEEIYEDEEKALVVFYKNFKSEGESVIHEFVPSEKEVSLQEISRSKILKNTEVIYSLEIGTIISYAGRDENDFMQYYYKSNSNEIKKILEKDIMVDFNRGDVYPVEQMLNYEFHQPYWYAKRKIASEALNVMNNFGEGFKTLIGSRAFLFEHQIDTIIRGLSENPCRIMLADEVGLGKTIESLVILKGLKKKKEKALLIIPEALVNQWKNELKFKFWMNAAIYEGIDSLKNDIIIIQTENINKIPIDKLKEFDYCLIDEVHRAVGEESIFDRVLQVCKNVKNVILLSATPIQNRKEEYLKLLKLLKPSKYEKMTENEFADLHTKNSNIRKLVHSAYKELQYAYNDENDEDAIEEIFETLEEIVEELDDKCLEKMISDLDIDSEDMSEELVRKILAYLSINYQFEKDIIRHRREELKSILPSRVLDSIYYEMSTENYEENTYEALIRYIEHMKVNINWSERVGEYIRVLLNSMFSSPWALNTVIKERIKAVKNDLLKNTYNDRVITSYRKEKKRIKNIIGSVETFEDEINYLMDIDYLVYKCMKESDNEIRNIKKMMEDPDSIMGRLGKVLDYIEEELYDKKVVIFTSWSETLHYMNKALINMYGDKAVTTFCINNTTEELEENVFKFQNNEECRIMICDELGGEGRNFQMADAIIHLDLPFAPTVLEQRIGRLDRIGRDKDKNVLNVVPVTEGTIETSLFELWNEGLNIFNESLSGLEIALEDINYEVVQALQKDIKYGLSDSINKIKENLKYMKRCVEEERYYDMAKQLDRSTKKKYDEIINKFDKDGGKLLAEMMRLWAGAVGFTPVLTDTDILEFSSNGVSQQSMINTMFSIPDTDESLKRSRKANAIRGTFNRELAVNREDLVFFAPGENIFDSIMKNVEEGYRARCTAISIPNTGVKWEGIIFKWNKNFNINVLLESGVDINYLRYIHGNISAQQYTSIVQISDEDVEEMSIREYIENQLNLDIIKSRVKHIGRRSKGNINVFKTRYPKSVWRNIVKNAYNQSFMDMKANFKVAGDIKKIKRDFAQIYAGAKASEEFFGEIQNCEDLKIGLQTILKGLNNPEVYIDSILYLIME